MARKCRECGRPMRATRQDYRYVESGLQHVLLKNIVVYECDCGGQIAEIPNMGPLHRAIMMDLLTKKTLLCGEEIRFLRKMARLKAKELAELLGVTPQQVSKWENDAKPVGKTSDRVLRLICYTGLIQRLVNDKGGLLVDLAAKVALRSEFDIHTLLRSIKHKQKGPKSVTIDPALFNDGGDGEPDRSLVH